MSGKFSTSAAKPRLFQRVQAVLANPGKVDKFKNYDGHPKPVPRAIKDSDVEKLISALLE
jgi:hypothetical protein